MRIALFLAALSLQGATYYVSSTGNDSNPGSIGSPWLTFNKAAQTVATGDTIIIVANGSRVTCDATLPATVTNITVQSSALASLPAVGYRVNPATDSANFGKCQFSGTGIIASGEAHGFNQGNTYQQASVNLATNTFTVTGPGWTPNGLTVANGTQIECELYNEFGVPNAMPTSTACPTPLVALQHYWIINCSSCGSNGGTFQLALTAGGSAIDITACDSDCATYVTYGLPMQCNATADTVTAPDTLGAVYVNSAPITFGSGGLRLASSLCAPLAQDTIYYVKNLSGNGFQVSATPGGAAIDLTNVGTGMQTFSNQLVPHGWKFSGIEFAPTTGNFMSNVLIFGGGKETSPLSMPDSMELDRVWIHDFSQSENGPNRGVAENGTNFYMHDSWCDGMKSTGEAQCIAGWGSYGPTRIINNFLEGSGENVLYGGSISPYYPLSNQNKTITGNYFYKPYIWKWTSGAYGNASGACLSDAANSPDPRHRGGEYMFDTVNSQGWLCVSGTWTMTGTTPTHYPVKNLLECKNCRNMTVTGNVFEGNWTDGQAGNAFAFGQRTDSGPGDALDHFSIANNKITKAYRVFSWGSICTGTSTGNTPCVNGVTNNLSVRNNLAVLGGPAYCTVLFTSVGCGFNMWNHLWSGRATLQNTWDHNTVVQTDGPTGSPYTPQSFLYDTLMTATLHNLDTFTNSIDGYDFFGQRSYFSTNFTNTTWNRMALKGAVGDYTTGGAGTGNTMTNTSLPANNAAIGFVNTSTGDYRLAPTSPYSASCSSGCAFTSSDGTDLGADVEAINAAISGAVAGTPTWAVQESFTITPGSTSAVATYTRPGSTACSMTLYNAPARTTANENADTNTSGKKLDTRTGNTVVGSNVTFNLGFNSPLTPATTYYYKLSCVAADMSTWLLAGDSFTTLGSSGVSTRISGAVTISGRAVIH